MKRRPEDITLDATGGGVMLAAVVAVALVIYAMLAAVHLLPPSVVTQNLARLIY